MSGDQEKPPGKAHRLGTRASANTSGPDFTGHRAIEPLDLRNCEPLLGFAPNEENLFLLPDRPLAGENSLK
jgi:hypothetical protein